MKWKSYITPGLKKLGLDKSGRNKSRLGRPLIGSVLTAGGMLAIRAAARSVTKFNLKGKVVLITGGSRGLGLVLARQIADEKAKVVICARNQEALQKAAEDLSERTPDFLAIPCNITDKEQVKRMMQKINDKMGAVDVLINNAGKIQVGPVEAMTEEDYKSAMKVHFWGPYYTMNEVIPSMIEKKQGRIVNIVSVGGKVSFPHLLPYNASKYALSGLSEGMAAELNKHNIKITTVYPGLMRTGSPRNVDVKGQHQKEFAWFKISDSLPFISMNAERAATKIINAMKKGDKSITLTFPAKIAEAAHGIAPGLTITFFDLINFLLPGMDGGSKEILKGYESGSKLSSSFLTKKTEEAEVKNFEK